MNHAQNLKRIEVQIARDKKLLSANLRKQLRAATKDETAREIQKLEEGIASLEQVAAWLRYKNSMS